MNKEQFEKKYWQYFLLLEEDFVNLEKTIPIDTKNYNTYSIKYMKLLFSICSEIDVLFKAYIEYNGWYLFNKNDSNMRKYREITTSNLKKFSNEVIVFSKQINLSPFINWQNSKPPEWWDAYNDLKHNRTLTDNYSKATQINIINAFAALYQLEMYFYKSIIEKEKFEGKLRMPVPQSKNCRIINWPDNVNLIDNRFMLYINNDGDLIQEGI